MNKKLLKMIEEEYHGWDMLWNDERVSDVTYRVAEKWRKEGIEEVLQHIEYVFTEIDPRADLNSVLEYLSKLKQKK